MEEGQDGSQTLNQALFDLCDQGVVEQEAAIAAAFHPDDLGYMLKNVTRRSSRSGLQTKDYLRQVPR
jgi:twitching motility protein PilT